MAGERVPLGRVFLPFKSLPHVVDIIDRQDMDDDAGGRIPNPNPAVRKRNVPCWVVPLSSDELMEFARQDLKATHRVFFFQDPSVGPGDTLRFNRNRLVVSGPTNELQVDLVWTVLTQFITKKPITRVRGN